MKKTLTDEEFKLPLAHKAHCIIPSAVQEVLACALSIRELLTNHSIKQTFNQDIFVKFLV